MVQGFTTIADLQLYWKTCEDVYLDSMASQHYQSLLEPLSNVYSYILEYQARAICHLSKKQLSRAWNKLSGQEDWASKETYLLKVSDRCNAFVLPLQKEESRERFLIETKKLDEICQVGGTIVEIMQDASQIDKEQTLMKKLETGAGDYQKGMEFNEDPVPGTCEWFYNDEELSNWLSADGPGVFWVTAGPGCGKSVLAKSLIKNGYLQATTGTITTSDSASYELVMVPRPTIGYFFFKDESPQRMSITAALCAILHELFRQDPEKRWIKRALDAYPGSATVSTSSLDELWDMLVAVAKDAACQIVCVLDALDECDAGDRNRLMTRLARLMADSQCSTTNLKFLTTSRPYDDIELSFQPLLKQATYYRFDADERYKGISHDISLVIDANIESLYPGFRETDRQKISKLIKARGTNTYLWLTLTLDIIKSNPSRYSRRRDVEAFLASLPKEVSGAYDKILSRTNDEEVTCYLLQIILAARQPLTVDEANYALTLARDDYGTHDELEQDSWPGDFKTIVKNLCGLIINVYDGKLSFIHLTAREFLTTAPEPAAAAGMAWAGRFADPAALHAVLARCCMRYLLLSDFASRQLPATPDETDEYKLLWYAARSWPSHFLALDNDTRTRYLPEARQLCSTSQPPVRTWGSYYVCNFHGDGPVYLNFYGWSDLAIVSFVGLQVLVEDLVETVGVDVNELCGGYGTALHAAVAGCHEKIAAYLISKKADVDITPSKYRGTPLDFAIGLRQHRGIIQLLLKHGASPLKPSKHGAFISDEFYRESRSDQCIRWSPSSILACAAMLPEKDIFYTLLSSLLEISTPEAIIDAATDERILKCGDECVAMVLDCLTDEWLADKRVLTANSLKSLLSVPSVGKRVIRIIKEQNRQHLLFQKAHLEVAARINGMADVLCNFISQSGQPSKYITQGILETIALHYDPDTLRLFIQSSSYETCTIKDLLIPAFENMRYCHTMPFIVLEFALFAITADEELQRRLLKSHSFENRQEEARVRLFLQLPKPPPFIKKLLIIAALKCRISKYYGEGEHEEMMRQVLKHCNDAEAVDGDVLEFAAAYSSAAVVQLLLKHNPALSMAEERYLVAASISREGRDVMKFLLRKYGPEVVITPRVASEAVGSFSGVFEMLLRVCPEKVPITADVVHRFRTTEMLQALLRHRYDGMKQIASELLHRVANPFQFHFNSIPILLDCCPLDWFKPTETLVLDVLEGGHRDMKEHVSVLIKAFDNMIPITERILASAIASPQGDEMPDIFKNWKPDQFKITPWIVEKVAAGGSPKGLDYLFRASGGQLVIDDKWYALARFRYHVRQWKGYRRAWAEVSDGDVADADGKTALHIATDGQNFSRFAGSVPLAVARFLLNETDADVHAKDRRGWTALHFAVHGDKLGLVTMLLAAGADPHQAGLNGHTPISLVESDFMIDNLEMDRDTLLLVLRDEWCASFFDPTLGREDDEDDEDDEDWGDDED